MAMAMAMSFVMLLPLFFSPLFSLIELTALIPPIDAQSDSQNNHDYLIFEIREANLKVAQLESVLEKSIQDLNAKSLYISESEKKIQVMTHEINRLQTTLASFEDGASSGNEMLHALQEEVRLLWAVSRKNNFEIHILEYKVQGAEEGLNKVTSQVEEMGEIVSEQWIQIQQLEQAVQITQVRISKLKRQLRFARCPFVKLMKNLIGEHFEVLKGILDPRISRGGSLLKFCFSEVLHHAERTFRAAKYYHHQGFIKQSMLRNEMTAILANEEVVFFVASALITFPVLSVYMLLSSRFS